MVKEVEVTLYDLFGYLFPGAVFFGFLVLLYSLLFAGSTMPVDGIAGLGWAVLLACSYVLGHVVQALANLLLGRWGNAVSLGLPKAEADPLKRKVAEVTGLAESSVDDDKLLSVCESYLQQNGKTEAGDIYVCREGFYRGMALATFLLALAVLTAAALKRPVPKFTGVELWPMTGWHMALTAALLGIAAELFF